MLAAWDNGRSTGEVATHFNVSKSWMHHAKQERREALKRGQPVLNPERLVFIDET